MAKSSPSFIRSAQAKSVGAFKIAQNAVVCSEAQLLGDITIGGRTVVHPTVKILAEGGPIIIGNNNLIMEQTVIINKKREDGLKTTMVIGDGNVFEFSSHCESLSVGNDNVFEAKCFVGSGVTVSDRCVIGACCVVDAAGETLPPSTVITGQDHLRWTKEATTQASNSQQLEVLVKLLPNFHKLTK